MNIALLYHPWNLQFRGQWDWKNLDDDPRGMSGSELGFVELARSFAAMGHAVWGFTDTKTFGDGRGVAFVPWDLDDARRPDIDLAIAINHTDGLQHFHGQRIALQWVNSFEYLSREQMQLPDHWVSPSEAHREFILSREHEIEMDQRGVVHGTYTPHPDNWSVARLGCTPSLYERRDEKVKGRCLYASSPDRGLHHMLQAWPAIKRQVPEATLHIAYRLRDWLEDMRRCPWTAAVGENKQRALYIEDALRRLSHPRWGITEIGRVSRNRIVREMCEAEVLSYPCDTLRWSEGFSCSVLEACAAGTVPVIFDCDALSEVYRDVATIVERRDLGAFTQQVVSALRERKDPNKLIQFAKEHTWKHTAQNLLAIASGLKAKVA